MTTATERVAEWDEVYRLLRDAYPEIGGEALALTAATLLIPGGAAMPVPRRIERARFVEVPGEGDAAPSKAKPVGAICVTCEQPIGEKDSGVWHEDRGVWTHSIPTCLLPGQISADPMKDLLSGKVPLAGVIDA